MEGPLLKIGQRLFCTPARHRFFLTSCLVVVCSSAYNASERDYVAGFNYFIRQRYFKLQFNYLRKTYANRLLPSRNVLLLNLQTWW